jgi:hypothetical protein
MEIGEISNYYGGLEIFKKGGKFFWIITSSLSDDGEPEEIPERLYSELKKFEMARKRAAKKKLLPQPPHCHPLGFF